ncbi:MAG TPA: arginase family protein [Streptosporangiaceae bacterium]
MTTISVLGVPSAAGTHGPGQETAPQALRAAGLVQRLKARGLRVDDRGDLDVVPFAPDPANRTQQNAGRVVDTVRQVAGRVSDILDGDGLPLIIGGDCTITLGVVAAYARRHPELGLMYFDGDIDVSTPQSTVSGIVDTMGMAHLLGQGIPELAHVGPRYPLLAGGHIVAFGYDQREPSAEQELWLREQGVACHPANQLTDPAGQAGGAWASLAGRASPILLHFDVDVIDSTDFPLADFPHFNEGLPYDDAMRCLNTFCAAPLFAGLVVTEINPHRDPGGVLIDRLLTDLTAALAQTADRPGQAEPGR